MNLSPFLTSAALFWILLNSVSVSAQKKQKDIQESSVFVSGPVKIDGKLNEWQDSLQAFNRAALIGYTIANDNRNLYLIIKSSDAINSAKILAGGISLTINTEAKKKEKEAFNITFPVINTVSRATPQRGSSGMTGGQRQMQGGGLRQTDRGSQVQRKSKGTDSVIIERRKAQIAQFKEIKVFGFQEIQDSLISIYNEYGIKVAAGYDTQGSLNYELAVPLKLLDLTADSKKELAYNIKINGRSFGGRNYSSHQDGDSDDRTRRGSASYGSSQGRSEVVAAFGEPVDFWGKYSLVIQ